MMQIRRIELTAETFRGPYTFEWHLEDGLNVLSAENTAGKSTVFQAMMFGLGLDHMFGPIRAIPLQYVMTSHVNDPELDEPVPVSESWVDIDIVNERDDRLSIRRYAKSQEYDSALVQVWRGRYEERAVVEQRDYYVGREGSATRERGFQRLLTDFLGWDVPLVETYEGVPTRLYMEILAPLHAIEQKRGWSGLFAGVPRHLRVRRPAERAFEFMLGLGSGGRTARIQDLQGQQRDLRTEWVGQRQALVDSLGRLATQVVPELPDRPTLVSDAPWKLWAAAESGWLEIDEARSVIESELSELGRLAIRSVAPSDSIDQVVELQTRLKDLLTRARSIQQQVEVAHQAVERLRERLGSIEEDLDRHRDVVRLRSLGSTDAQMLEREECPTCRQSVSTTLLYEVTDAPVMSVDQNIEYLDQQRSFVQAMLGSEVANLDRLQSHQSAIHQQAQDAQYEMRAATSDAIHPRGTEVSETTVERRLSLQRRMDMYSEAEAVMSGHLEALDVLGRRYLEIADELRALRNPQASSDDEQRLAALRASVVSQLRQYEFTTFNPDGLELTQDSYEPTWDGFELAVTSDTSASDLVRIIWSYTVGLLEVNRSHDGNHPGFVVMDEPRQQSVSDESFAQLLHRLSDTGNHRQQAIVLSSEPITRLDRMLQSIPHTVTRVEARLLARA